MGPLNMTTFQDKRMALHAAVADIPSGASIFIGGFGGAGMPARLLEALCARTEVDNLTLINNNAGAADVSFLQLVESGRVSRILCSYPRMPGSEPIRRQVQAGQLEVLVMSQGTFVERIRAAGAGLGPFYTPTGYGTRFAEGKQTCMYQGRGHVLEEPLHADYAFVKADVADAMGNLTYRLAQRNFGPVMCTAARVTIVEAREVVTPGDLAPSSVVTPGVFVNRLVEVQ